MTWVFSCNKVDSNAHFHGSVSNGITCSPSIVHVLWFSKASCTWQKPPVRSPGRSWFPRRCVRRPYTIGNRFRDVPLGVLSSSGDSLSKGPATENPDSDSGVPSIAPSPHPSRPSAPTLIHSRVPTARISPHHTTCEKRMCL